MSKTSAYNFDTLSLHAGQAPDTQYGARAAPIYLTTSFVFKDADQAAALFNMERGGHVYSRISNPTNAVLEERIAALEGGVGRLHGRVDLGMQHAVGVGHALDALHFDAIGLHLARRLRVRCRQTTAEDLRRTLNMGACEAPTLPAPCWPRWHCPAPPRTH